MSELKWLKSRVSETQIFMVCKKCLQEFKEEIDKLQTKAKENAEEIGVSEYYERKEVYPVNIFLLTKLIKKWEKQSEDLWIKHEN